VGYPNVGKSALINRLAGRKAAKSEDRAGVTRSLGWVRSKSNDGRPPPFELLDSPGIIPAKQNDPRQAARLAMCGRIGQASYDERRVAEALLMELRSSSYAPGAAKKIQEKYGLSLDADPDLFLAELADQRYDGDDARAAVAVLGDFRSGRLGNVALEGPPPREIVEEPAVVEAAPTEPVEKAAESDFDRRMSEGDFAGW
jgi:ribosome biogenesis GTPase A